MDNPQDLRDSLRQFTNPANHYSNAHCPWMLYTDGVKFFAENAGGGAQWLLDLICIQFRKALKQRPFLHFRLIVADGRAVLLCEDGNGQTAAASRRIPRTDCPPGEWEFFHTGGVLMLPSEY